MVPSFCPIDPRGLSHEEDLYRGVLLWRIQPSLAGMSYGLAKKSKGEGPLDYSGVTGIYYTVIGLILAFGVYVSSFKKS